MGDGAGGGADRCWCVSASFSPALMARVPTSSRGVTCVCATCASRLPRRPDGSG